MCDKDKEENESISVVSHALTYFPILYNFCINVAINYSIDNEAAMKLNLLIKCSGTEFLKSLNLFANKLKTNRLHCLNIFVQVSRTFFFRSGDKIVRFC